MKPFRLFASAVACALSLSACGSGLSTGQVHNLVETSVVGTLEARNQIAAAVVLTLTALAPPATATASPTFGVPELPMATLIASTGTPFVAPTVAAHPQADYACSVLTRPYDRTAFKPGDPFDIKWIITNTGAKTWSAGRGLNYMSGPHLTTRGGVELPKMEPGDTFSFSADANAPLEKGFYVMTWKVEGGFCYPYVAIVSGTP
jgi:hypothetical protein